MVANGSKSRISLIISLLQKAEKFNRGEEMTPNDYQELMDIVDYFTVEDPVKTYSDDDPDGDLEPSLTLTLKLSDGKFLGLVIYLDIDEFAKLEDPS